MQQHARIGEMFTYKLNWFKERSTCRNEIHFELFAHTFRLNAFVLLACFKQITLFAQNTVLANLLRAFSAQQKRQFFRGRPTLHLRPYKVPLLTFEP
jgi:hypothetical protein